MDSDKDKKQPKEQAEDTVKQPEQLSDLAEGDPPTNQTTNMQPKMERTMEEEPAEPPIEKSNKRLFVIGAVIAAVLVLVVAGFFLTQRKNISQDKEAETSSAPTATPKPTEAAKPAIKREEWSLEVLNGTGVTGAAKKLADKLAQLGYKILKTGNADRSDYTKSELFVAKDMKDKQDLLLEDLKKEVNIASVAGELKDSTASARIIIGKE